jgi:putative transposase
MYLYNKNNINNMLVTRVVKCRMIELTKTKREIIEQEYERFQFWLQSGIDINVYGNYKNQFDWHWDKRRKIQPKDYPMQLANTVTRIKINKNKISNYWFNFKTKEKWGGIWVAIKSIIPLENLKIRDCKIIKRKDTFFVELSIQKQVAILPCSSAISIDIGEKVLATVRDADGKPIFYGAEIRGIRRHYNYLRKVLGQKKRFDKIKQIGSKEQNVVDNLIHEITKEIVTLATSSNSAIVLGNLKNLKVSAKNKGRRFNRLINQFAYSKLTHCIEYKASWLGIPVYKVNEAYTSKTCSRCGLEGSRFNQGLFICKNCNYRVNADFNGAKNIYKKWLSEKQFSNILSDEMLSSDNGAMLRLENSNNERNFEEGISTQMQSRRQGT